MNMADPVILWSGQFDSPTSDSWLDQCDCACPDTQTWATCTAPALNTPLRQAQVHRQPLTDDFSLFFNPLADAGVAVLDKAAATIWGQFQTPQFAPNPDCGATALHTIERLQQAALLQPAAASVERRRGQPQTLLAWLHVTNACNLRCDYCYVHKSAEAMDESTGRAAVDAILRVAQQRAIRQVKLKFAGGEATLNLKRVLEIFDYAHLQSQDCGIQVDAVVLSNGVAIGDHAIATLSERGIRISISLDGLGASHDVHRTFANGSGSFRYVERTLDRLLSRGVRPFLSITLSNHNADGLPSVVGYALERDLPFNINFGRENDCAVAPEALHLHHERIIDAIHRAFDVIEAHLPDRSLLGAVIDRSTFDRPHDKPCSAGESYLVIDARGRIAKCQMEIEQPITDVFASDPLAMLAAAPVGVQNLPVEDKEGCKSCQWRYWCAGGCPLLTYRSTGRFDVKSPFCLIYQALYPDLLRLEGLRLLKLGKRLKMM